MNEILGEITLLSSGKMFVNPVGCLATVDHLHMPDQASLAFLS